MHQKNVMNGKNNYQDPSIKYDKWQIIYVPKFSNRIDSRQIIKQYFCKKKFLQFHGDQLIH